MRRPPLPRMLARGLVRRCPWCGGRGAFFSGWFAKQQHCRHCGLRWRRDDVGFELGAAAIAAIICLGPLVVALGVMVAITWPELVVIPLVVVLGVGALTLPVLLYPSSYTVWQAIDIVMRPVTPGDFDVAVVAGTREGSRSEEGPGTQEGSGTQRPSAGSDAERPGGEG